MKDFNRKVEDASARVSQTIGDAAEAVWKKRFPRNSSSASTTKLFRAVRNALHYRPCARLPED